MHRVDMSTPIIPLNLGLEYHTIHWSQDISSAHKSYGRSCREFQWRQHHPTRRVLAVHMAMGQDNELEWRIGQPY
jgi:hypothetical protein